MRRQSRARCASRSRFDRNGSRFDSLGRLGVETRPDGTEMTVTRSRTKDGGPLGNGWRVMQRSTTTGGADDTVELDSLGRPIRWLWHGAAPDCFFTYTSISMGSVETHEPVTDEEFSKAWG